MVPGARAGGVRARSDGRRARGRARAARRASGDYRFIVAAERAQGVGVDGSNGGKNDDRSPADCIRTSRRRWWPRRRCAPPRRHRLALRAAPPVVVGRRRRVRARQEPRDVALEQRAVRRLRVAEGRRGFSRAAIVAGATWRWRAPRHRRLAGRVISRATKAWRPRDSLRGVGAGRTILEDRRGESIDDVTERRQRRIVGGLRDEARRPRGSRTAVSVTSAAVRPGVTGSNCTRCSAGTAPGASRSGRAGARRRGRCRHDQLDERAWRQGLERGFLLGGGTARRGGSPSPRRCMCSTGRQRRRAASTWYRGGEHRHQRLFHQRQRRAAADGRLAKRSSAARRRASCARSAAGSVPLAQRSTRG